MKRLSLLSIPLVAACLSGCVSLVRGVNEDVTFESVPTEAEVRLSNGLSGRTPCTIPIPRKKMIGVTVEKEGYHSHYGYLTPMVGGDGYIMGTYVDYSLGTVYDLKPNPYKVHLIPDQGPK